MIEALCRKLDCIQFSEGQQGFLDFKKSKENLPMMTDSQKFIHHRFYRDIDVTLA